MKPKLYLFVIFVLTHFTLWAQSDKLVLSNVYNCDLECKTAIKYDHSNLHCPSMNRFDTLFHYQEDLFNPDLFIVKQYIIDNLKKGITLFESDQTISRNADDSARDTVTILNFKKTFRISNSIQESYFECHDFREGSQRIDTMMYLTSTPCGTWEFYDKDGKIIKLEKKEKTCANNR